MVQEFSVCNYLSIGDWQTISFEATSDKTLRKELTIEPKLGTSILKANLIYGANATGKSNMLSAMNALWVLLLFPAQETHEKIKIYRPFATKYGEPTHFKIVFWINSRKFEYKLVHDENKIHYEKMLYSSDKGVLSDMYKREQDGTITFGNTLKMTSKQKNDLIKEILPNHTILSTLSKKNLSVPPIFHELHSWISNNVKISQRSTSMLDIAEEASNDPKLKAFLLNILAVADFNIIDFRIVQQNLMSPDLEKRIHEEYPEDATNILKEFSKKSKTLIFTHKKGDSVFDIDYSLESSGTSEYFRLCRMLYNLLNDDLVIIEDEIEDSLHYDLLIHFLETFLQSNVKSQLIFTTHSQMILNEDWLIRRDMIWMTEKDRDNAYSKFYRVSDLGIHKNLSLLNAYKIGKLGGKPRLGSPLLNISENK